MATVDSGILVIDRVQADGSRMVKYSFVLTDNESATYDRESAIKRVPAGFDTTADMLVVGPMLLSAEADQEIKDAIDSCSAGGMPIHVDMGGWYEKSVPLWNTWDDVFAATAQHFFGLPDQISLAPYYATWSQVTKQDKQSILGIDNQTESDMNGDIDIAIDLQTQMDSYVPYFDSEGNLI